MSLKPGTKLGPYEITAAIGAGGMGEVYRATDTRLDRTVAVKVLPSHLSDNPQLRQRFEREARAVSGLNHPNICTLHDVGEQDGVHYLVMEHLEGETLAERLEKGALPQEEVLRHATAIADALDQAHRQGVVHRDLKPGNVMLTREGAKLLDFGLAKSAETGPAGTSLTAAPTGVSPLTAEGTIVGTFQYMAPEQLEGKEADARSDIFAFGAVVYEMITGNLAFEGETQASLIGAIMRGEPRPLSALTPMTPPPLERLVLTCLAKDPADRRQTIRGVLLDLRWIAEAGSRAGIPVPVTARRRSRERLAWSATAVAVAVALTAVLWSITSRPGPVEARSYRSSILPPGEEGRGFAFDGSDSGSLTVSPDGRHITFAALTPEGKKFLWLRPLDSNEARPLPGTEGGEHPFWSPDSRFIAFFAGGKLRKIDLVGSPAVTLCDAPDGRSGGWNEEGVILFSPETIVPIHRVPAGGGQATPVTVLDESLQETTHRWATFLPDGRHFLFMAGGHFSAREKETHAIYLADLESGERELLLNARSNVAYASGHLLYAREGVLLAHPFDQDRRELTGDPFPIAEGVQYVSGGFRAVFSASHNGVIAYHEGSMSDEERLVWLDRTGEEIGSVGEPADYETLSLSPDGQRLAAEIVDPATGTSDIWIHDLSRDIATRLTFGNQDETLPVWSPDGKRILFAAAKDRTWPDLYVKDASGAGDEELVLRSEAAKFPTGWSPDGQILSYTEFRAQGETKADLFVLSMSGDREPITFLQTEFIEGFGVFSPNGRWMAYISDESGSFEVYVTAFPEFGGKWQVSKGGGGGRQQWTADGTELIYQNAEGKMMAVPVKTDSPTFEAGTPVELFELGAGVSYSLTSDGQRLIAAIGAGDDRVRPISLIVNWTADLHPR